MKTSIRKKIMTILLTISILLLIITNALFFFQINEVRDITETSLLKLSQTDLENLSKEKGNLINEQLETYTDILTVMAGSVADLYENEADYLPKDVPLYKDVAEGELVLHYFLNSEVSENGTLLSEIQMLGNSEKIFSQEKKEFPEITTICIATETGGNLQYDADAFAKHEFIIGGFSSHTRPWYIDTKEKNELIISDTYRDVAGRGLTITMSAPINANGVFKGVMCFDILIDDLDAQLRETVVGEKGRIDLIGDEGVISSRNLTAENDSELPSYWNSVSSSSHGTKLVQSEYVAWNTVPLTGWKTVYIVPESEITAPVTKANSFIVNAMIISAIIFIVMLLVTVWVAVGLSNRISSPITTLALDADKIGKGENLKLTANTGDEIELLAETINHMVTDIKKITGEKERIGAELDVATQIQSDMLPHIFPAYPHKPEIDLFGSMKPAKEVGGDFYDFFLIDENTLAVIIADVSGKGVPAALFMVIGKSLIKNNAQMGKSPKEVFETVNNVLCENNEAGLFITGFMAYLNLTTGELVSVNAGHNPPLLCRDGVFEYYKTKRGFVLAGMEDVTYTESKTIMNPNDTLYMYTDGVTEADNLQKELYGEDRLIKILNENKNETLNNICNSVSVDIRKFENGAEQADDITMLILKYVGKK
jgi:sigma-B regulation protein RsbU (phosphoserine phosphatase)